MKPPQRRVGAATPWEARVLKGAHPIAYPALAMLARRPVTRVPGIGVVVTDAELVRDILTDTEHFSKAGPGSASKLWTPVLGPSVLLNMAGEDHRKLRRTLSPLFTPKAVRAMVALEESSHLASLADRLAAGEVIDLVAEVSDLAGVTICRMTGLPPSDGAIRDAMMAAQEIIGLVRLHRRSLTPRQVRRAQSVLAGITEPAREAWQAGDEATVPGRMRALGLSEREALGAVGAFVLTGTETIQSFTPRLVALAADTGWLERLVLGPDRDRIIDEAFRVTVPSPVMLRAVVKERVIGIGPWAVRVRPGDRIVIATILACHAYGPFRPDRPQAPAVRQLWFGAGPHFCLGMPLAMAEITAILDAFIPALSAGRRVRIRDREVARKVLIPAYRRLEIEAA